MGHAVDLSPGGRSPGLATIGKLILEQARSSPERRALWARGKFLTYGELIAQAGAMAMLLAENGIGADDRVAILSERTTTVYAALVSALLNGSAYVPLNPRFPPKRNRQILESSGARALICSESQRIKLNDIVGGLPDLELLILPESEVRSAHGLRQLLATDLPPCDVNTRFNCEVAPGELAYLFFTSGTTGEPKGVPITNANVLAYLRGIRSVCQVGAEDRLLQVVDLTFDLSVHDMFLAWTSGALLFSASENATLLGSRFVAEHEITSWLSVPSAAALIKQAGLLRPACMPSLRFSFFCGEALTGAVAEAWAAAAPNSAVINIYGPTEATVAFSAFRYQPGQADPPAVISLGMPFPEQAMALFDDAGRPAASDSGEICLSGSQVTTGYWNAPQLTAERFFEWEGTRWYRTGDVGRFVPGEGFAYLGRVDRQVKIRGYRMELQEVEAAVRQVTGCDLAAVVPWPIDESGAALGCIAFVVGVEVAATALEQCRELLPDYAVPSRILTIDEIPLNANGKRDYRALSQRAASLSDLPSAPPARP
jgi:D-alanine--poly(phosphoribitol) ligase subunit 1